MDAFADPRAQSVARHRLRARVPSDNLLVTRIDGRIRYEAVSAERRLPDPLEVVPPPGAEGWEQMYSPYLLFSAENAEWERAQFWYWDGMHRPDVEYPFDTIVHEAYMMSVAAIVSRLFAVPGAKGAASRVLLGRLYLADIPFDRP
jgi:hypothetical protein